MGPPLTPASTYCDMLVTSLVQNMAVTLYIIAIATSYVAKGVLLEFPGTHHTPHVH